MQMTTNRIRHTRSCGSSNCRARAIWSATCLPRRSATRYSAQSMLGRKRARRRRKTGAGSGSGPTRYRTKCLQNLPIALTQMAGTKTGSQRSATSYAKPLTHLARARRQDRSTRPRLNHKKTTSRGRSPSSNAC